MGRPDRRPDERPPHTVTLRPFRAAPAPVTNAAYDLFLRHTRHDPPRFFDDPRFNHRRQPVVGVSWFDAVAYCDWLAAATGLPLRLPSEAEREYAALGAHSGVNGAGGDWPWGDADPPSPDQTSPGQTGYAPLAFVATADAPHIPQPACANAYGLRCMAENVHEWCADTYRRTYDPVPHPTIPTDTSRTDPAPSIPPAGASAAVAPGDTASSSAASPPAPASVLTLATTTTASASTRPCDHPISAFRRVHRWCRVCPPSIMPSVHLARVNCTRV